MWSEIRATRATLREGRADGFPVCCRWRYAVEELLSGGRSEQALHRGLRFTTTGTEHVPCRLSMRLR